MTFSAPVFISIGDEYDKKDNGLPERFKGRSFQTAPPKKGNGPDVLLSRKFISLSDGDKYVDPGYFDKRNRLEKERKKVGPIFKYTSGVKTPCGSGTYFGTFSEKNPPPHLVEYAVTKRGEMPDKAKPQLRNIVTNPPRRGTYGVPGTVLSKGDEFKYVSDPFDGEKRKEAQRAKESARRIDGPAFKAACRRGGFFDESSHGVSKVYTIDKALPAKRPAQDGHAAPLAKAWRPGGSLVTIITKPPEYMEDPFEAKEKAAREQRKKDRPAHGVWKPIGGSKTLPTKSIKFTPA
jgi:hypothetical protein